MRVAIFSYYNENGIITPDTDYLLDNLKCVTDRLIIVINGKISDRQFLHYSDDVIQRENCGWDAGAYKSALFDDRYNSLIKKSDELILCNNSFFGPFIPLKYIFEKMDSRDVDFWGLSSSEIDFTRHLQSFLLVFKRKTLCGDVFWRYFDEHIYEDEENYEMVCASFENGLFRELVKAEYKWDALIRGIKCDPYMNAYGSLIIDKQIILKKKSFSKRFYTTNSFQALNYIENEYDYPITVIKKTVREIYDFDLSNISIDEDVIPVPDLIEDNQLIDRNEVEEFIEDNEKIFIYGAGHYAKHIFSTFFCYRENPGLAGFLVSDLKKEKTIELYGYPILEYTYRLIEDNVGIIVGVSKEMTHEVEEMISDFPKERYLLLWKNNC